MYTIEKFKDGKWIELGKSNSGEEWLKLMGQYQQPNSEDAVTYRVRLGEKIIGELKLKEA